MSAECKFCPEFNGKLAPNGMPHPIGDRIVTSFDDCLLLPTLGCLVPGYSLLMPVQHELSFAWWLKNNGPERPHEIVDAARKLVESSFGPCIVAEHGAGSICHKGVACCDHAHLHIIPIGDDGDAATAAYVKRGGKPKELRQFDDLVSYSGESYLYLSPRSGEHFIWPSNGFACQFVRRVAATAHGIPDEWDWRAFPYTENMVTTRNMLRAKAGECGQRMVA